MLRLREDTLDTWRGNGDVFQQDILEFSYGYCKAVGLYFQFDQAELRKAHLDWVGQCGAWEAQHRAEGSNGLSHLKILALLLHCLSKAAWIRPDSVEAYERRDRDPEFNGSDEIRDSFRQFVIDAEGVCLAFQLVFYCLNWFESRRTDRLGPFEFRLTKPLEHDFVVYLCGDNNEPSAVYLILKALYARHPAAGSAHD